MDDEVRGEELRRELRGNGTAELAERWEAPMPDAERTILKAELEQRGHRMASLPAPPPHDAPARREPPPTPRVRARRAVGRARFALVFVGGLQLILSGWLAFVAFGVLPVAEAASVEPDPRLLGPRIEALVSFVFGLVFLALWRGSRDVVRPRVALGLGFALYLTITALLFAQDPAGAYRGIVVKAIVLVLLAQGLRATFSPALRQSENGAAAPPAPAS